MIRVDYFLDAMRTLGVNTTESRIKQLFDVKFVSHMDLVDIFTSFVWGPQSYIYMDDVRRVVDFYWKSISKVDESEFETFRKVEFITQKIIQRVNLEAITKEPTKEASCKELKELFHDIQMERGVDLALEMQRRGFKAVIRDFNVPKLNYLVMDGVKFINCTLNGLECCYIRNTKLPNTTMSECVSSEFSIPTLFDFYIKRIVGRSNADKFLIQTIMDHDVDEFRLLDFMSSSFVADGSAIWKKFVWVCSKKHLSLIVSNFSKFNIKDQDFCLAFVKEFFWNGNNVLLLFNKWKELGITDEKLVIDIIMHCASINGSTTGLNLFNYIKITDEQALVAIVMECLKTSSRIKHVEIISKFARRINMKPFAFEFAKLSPECFLYCIDRFQINDENILFELANICASKDPCTTYYNLKEFNFKQEFYDCIALQCMENWPKSGIDSLMNGSFDKISTHALINRLKNDSIFNVNIDLIKDDKETALWLCKVMFVLSGKVSHLKWFKDHQILSHMQKIDDLGLAKMVLLCLVNLRDDASFNDIKVRNVNTGKGKKAETALCLMELKLAFLRSENVSVDLISQHAKLFIDDTAKLNVFLRALSYLENEFSTRSLQSIISKAFANRELIMRRLNYISFICEFNLASKLINSNSIEETLNSILQEKLKNLIRVNDTVIEKLQSVFGSRYPQAIYIYVSRLNASPAIINTVRELAIINTVREFLQSIIDGKFLEYRYDISKNKHLKLLMNYDPHLIEKWKINSELKIGNSNAVGVNTDDPTDILLCGTETDSCQSVNLNNGHNKGLLGYLMNGQTRLLAVKSKAGPEGKIKARCLLRILWDDVWKKPVLLRERFYPSHFSNEMADVLNNLAKQKAQELGLALVTIDGGGDIYPHSIKSLGGWSIFEYVDAANNYEISRYEIDKGLRYLNILGKSSK